jgi:cell wall-associated NlpC family hydrolase
MKFLKIISFILASMLGSFSGCSSAEESASGNDSDVSDSEIPVTQISESAQQGVPAVGQKIVKYASTLEGTPYKEAGRDESGFDCSGFIYYVFKKYNVEVPHSSRHLAELGTEVDTSLAQPGDLVFFKGTSPDNPEVGHVGIVISKPGDPVKFIHASSATSSPHVKYDSLARPSYKRRFLKVKRLLTEGNS